jgi:uncharacterized protein
MRAWMRNSLLACSVVMAAGFGPLSPARAVESVEIRWENLIPAPPPQFASRNLMAMIAPHRQVNEAVNMSVWPRSDLVSAYDGRRVKISGFAVPFNNDELPYKRLLLIPFSGACVKFPPPRNQVILITHEKGIQLTDFVYPVVVTGIMNVAPTETDIAKIGYRISAESIVPDE